MSLTSKIAATIISCFLIAPAVAMPSEVIEITDCPPESTRVGGDTSVTCIPRAPGGGTRGDSVPAPTLPGDGGTGGGGGGGSEGTQLDAGSRFLAQVVAHCRACQSAGQECQGRASGVEGTCRTNAWGSSARRCSLATNGAGFATTAFGCSILAMRTGLCGTAEAVWTASDRWATDSTAESSCIQSWGESHPNGTQAISEQLTASISVKGFGVGAQGTLSQSATWDGHNGFLGACAALSSGLSQKCTTRELRCYDQNDCSSVRF